MTTYATLRANIARTLQDPDSRTFTDPILQDIVQACMAEIGRVAPRRFQEDLTPVADALEYTLLSDDFAVAVPEIEVLRVELWDGSQTPAMPLQDVEPYDQSRVNWTDNGWKVWDGILSLPRWVPLRISGHEDDYILRVWGYAPYTALSADDDVVPLSFEREQALVTYARVEGLQRLNASRELFTQWQTRSGNSDVSPAGLMNALNIAQQDWRQKSRAISVLREAPG